MKGWSFAVDGEYFLRSAVVYTLCEWALFAYAGLVACWAVAG